MLGHPFHPSGKTIELDDVTFHQCVNLTRFDSEKTITEKKSLTRLPIQMEFQVPMFTASGLRVRFLKVWEKSGYNTVEWVRYITKAGSYEIRC